MKLKKKTPKGKVTNQGNARVPLSRGNLQRKKEIEKREAFSAAFTGGVFAKPDDGSPFKPGAELADKIRREDRTRKTPRGPLKGGLKTSTRDKERLEMELNLQRAELRRELRRLAPKKGSRTR